MLVSHYPKLSLRSASVSRRMNLELFPKTLGDGGNRLPKYRRNRSASISRVHWAANCGLCGVIFRDRDEQRDSVIRQGPARAIELAHRIHEYGTRQVQHGPPSRVERGGGFRAKPSPLRKMLRDHGEGGGVAEGNAGAGVGGAGFRSKTRLRLLVAPLSVLRGRPRTSIFPPTEAQPALVSAIVSNMSKVFIGRSGWAMSLPVWKQPAPPPQSLSLVNA